MVYRLLTTGVLLQEQDSYAWLELPDGEEEARPYIEAENRFGGVLCGGLLAQPVLTSDGCFGAGTRIRS